MYDMIYISRDHTACQDKIHSHGLGTKDNGGSDFHAKEEEVRGRGRNQASLEYSLAIKRTNEVENTNEV